MILRYDDDLYECGEEGSRLLAAQAARARMSVQIASLDGTNSRWSSLNVPGLLLVSRGKTLRLSGAELDALIAACEQDAEFAVGDQEQPCTSQHCT